MQIVRRETAILLLGDLTILASSLIFALFVRRFEWPSFDIILDNIVPFIPLFFLSLFVFYIAGLYEKQTIVVKRTMGERIFWTQFGNSLIAAVVFFILPLSIAPKTILLLYLFISVFLVSVWRLWVFPKTFVFPREQGVLIAHGSASLELRNEVNSNNRYRIMFADHLDPTMMTADELSKRIRQEVESGARVLVMDSNNEQVRKATPLLYNVMLQGVPVLQFSSLYEDIFDRVPLEHIDHAWLLENIPHTHVVYDFFKRVFDIVLALLGLIVAIPFVALASLVLLFDGGAPFIFPERVGKNGETIRLVKLRTMLFFDNGDPEKQKQNRVTTCGKFLRKTRIDELPQLWNILKGELSFIGPRPELPKLAEVYERAIPYYHVRHLITPGLSGWAQIKDYNAPRGQADIEKTSRKLSYDLLYLKQRSFGFDLAIALKTIRALLSFSGT